MGLFSHHHARDAYDQVYGGGRPPHEVTHELLAGAAAFEAMRMYEHHREREGIPEHHELAKELLAGFVGAEIDKHFEQDRYGHLNRREARRLAEEQAELPLARAVRPPLLTATGSATGLASSNHSALTVAGSFPTASVAAAVSFA